MPLYAVIGFDHSPHQMTLRDQVRPAHRAVVKQNDQMIRFATAMLDGEGNQRGSIYFFEADSADTVRAWLAQEPFCIAGVYDDLCHSIPLAQQIQRIYEHDITAYLFPGEVSAGRQAFVHNEDVLDSIVLAVTRRKELPPEVTLLIGEPQEIGAESWLLLAAPW